MSWLQNTVTRRYNVRHMAWGHLFGDRYKAVLVDGADSYHYRTLKEGLAAAGLAPEDLPGIKGPALRKLVLAELVWKRTTVSQVWIAERLSMSSASNVSQQLRRMNTRKTKVKLPPKLQRFLTETLQNGN